MNKTFRALSALLTYPTAELKSTVGEFRAALDGEASLSPRIRAKLDTLLDQLEDRDLYDLQERYVLLFDRTRSLSLHLFEHIHGESRDRGQAMVDLAMLYEKHGLQIDAKEVPDYLPLFMEFLSTLEDEVSSELLQQPLHIIAALRQRLKKRSSPYAAVFWALEEMAQGKPKAGDVRALLDEPEDDPEDLEALDETWAEEPVTFGPGAGGCPKVAGMAARLNAANPPATPSNSD